jgi:hypothetical protein
LGGIPNFLEPAQLFFAGAAQVHFSDGDGPVVAFPDFLQQGLGGTNAFGANPHGFHIGVGVVVVATVGVGRVAIEPVIEEAIAGQIAVDAKNIGRAGVIEKPG